LSNMTKVLPFRYPKSKHLRRFSPPQRRSYKAYKSILREEFYHRCVYCTFPDLLKGQECFGTDHYRPKAAFPNLVSEYTNLFYACNVCNSRKREFWPSFEQWKKGHFVPNPCDHVMYDIMRAAGSVIEGRNETGKFAIELLDLNDSEAIQYRQLVIDLCQSMRNEVKRMNQTKEKLAAQIVGCTDVAKKNELQRQRETLEDGLQRISGNLIELLGE